MITKLPRWVWVGAWALALNAGMIDVIALLSATHQAVSHLTGVSASISIAAASGDRQTLKLLAGVVGSFFCGAVVSGMIIRSPALQLGRRYTFLLMLEACAIILALVAIRTFPPIGIDLLCFACGLQNAIASTYSGAIIRTTHMTGMYTDLGVLIGQIFRGVPIDWRRLILYSVILFGFLLGGVIGARLSMQHGTGALLAPAILTILLAWVYAILRRRSVTYDGATSTVR